MAIASPPAATFLGLSTGDIVGILIAVVVLAGFVAAWAGTQARNPIKLRIAALKRSRGAGRLSLIDMKRTEREQKANDLKVMIYDFLGRLKVLQSDETRTIQEKLAQAGIRSKEAVLAYQFARLVGPFLAGAVVILLIQTEVILVGAVTTKKMIAAFAGVLGGYYAPVLYVKNRIASRLDRVRKALPDVLDLLVICAEAGLTVHTAFDRVARELAVAFPDMADEIGLAAIELSFLQDRRQAYENLAKRVDLPAMRAVVTTLIQTEKYGTPLASSLEVLTAEFRNERMMRAEEKAARLPAIMTVPLILFVLPVLFIVLLGPAACTISDNIGKQ